MITHFEDKKNRKSITQLIRGTVVKKKKTRKMQSYQTRFELYIR